jgi:endonuclease YncB( thermonuclease family)
LAALEALIAGFNVRGEVVERDRPPRSSRPKGSTGRRFVSAGWALAYGRYSTHYVDAENEAHKAKRGMWRGTFVKPCGVARIVIAVADTGVAASAPAGTQRQRTR